MPSCFALLVSLIQNSAPYGTRSGGWLWVVKAQVQAGGRGKAGGVKVVKLK
jgi:succinyl-CoA synthetase beta subunit